jgi:hypothetical protein
MTAVTVVSAFPAGRGDAAAALVFEYMLVSGLLAPGAGGRVPLLQYFLLY